MMGRSAEFLGDVDQFPLLRGIYWLSDSMWDALKASPQLNARLERPVGWMHDVRYVPRCSKSL